VEAWLRRRVEWSHAPAIPRAHAALVILFLAGGSVAAQDTVPRQTWSVDGVVQLGKRSGATPVANQWVVVHRIASDATGKVSGGALDSGRTDSRGRYKVSFPRHGSSQATYIAITTYSGVSYITAPLSRPRTTGDDAAIMVFDTTAPPYPIRVAGRHLVITSPDSGDRRRVIEVYELMNDSTFTVMGTETNPVWRAPVPKGVSDVEINPTGDISPAMTKAVGEWLHIFSPISPGIRQISFTYTLGPDAFPLTLPVVDSATVFELLVQEQDAVVEGGGFTEVAAVQQEGVLLRRLLAQNVPSRTVLRFSMPKPVSRIGRKGVTVVAGAISAAMVLALGFVFWRRRRPREVDGQPPRTRGEDPVDALVRQLATMDADFERRGEASADERAAFAARRAELKARLNAALADAHRPS
jgi:hypothetical protein